MRVRIGVWSCAVRRVRTKWTVHLAFSEPVHIPDMAAALIKLNLRVRLARHLFGYGVAGARSETIGREYSAVSNHGGRRITTHSQTIRHAGEAQVEDGGAG